MIEFDTDFSTHFCASARTAARITAGIGFLSIFCSAAHAQGLSIDQMVQMTGTNEPHLQALQTKTSFQNQPLPQSGYDTSNLKSNYEQPALPVYRPQQPQVEEFYGYENAMSRQRPNWNAQPRVPRTTTAVQSLEGSFGASFGRTQISSGRFSYGFSQGATIPYRGVSGNRRLRGRALPPVSTASVDIDTVDR